MWSRDQGLGGGVQITGVSRMTDAFLDAPGRTEHGKQSYLDARARVCSTGSRPASASRATTGSPRCWPSSASPGPTWPTTRAASAARSPGARPRPARGRRAAPAGRATSRRGRRPAGPAQRDGRTRSTRSPPTWLRPTRRSRPRTLNGSDAGNLLDQRDQLALRLSELTGGKARPTPPVASTSASTASRW